MADDTERLAGQAEDELDALVEAGLDGADAISSAFRLAGAEIESALVEAARTGELTFQDLAQSIARDFSALGVQNYVRAPIGEAVDGLVAAAQGLFGLPGAPAPQSASPAGLAAEAARSVVVNVSMSGAAVASDGLHRSQAQIAGAVGRAAAQAMRRL